MVDAYTLMMDLKLYTGAWMPRGGFFTVISSKNVAAGSKCFPSLDILLTLFFLRWLLLFGLRSPTKHTFYKYEDIIFSAAPTNAQVDVGQMKGQQMMDVGRAQLGCLGNDHIFARQRWMRYLNSVSQQLKSSDCQPIQSQSGYHV